MVSPGALLEKLHCRQGRVDDFCPHTCRQTFPGYPPLPFTMTPTSAWKFYRVHYIVIVEEEHRFNFPAGVFLLMNRGEAFVLLRGRERRGGSVARWRRVQNENDTR